MAMLVYQRVQVLGGDMVRGTLLLEGAVTSGKKMVPKNHSKWRKNLAVLISALYLGARKVSLHSESGFFQGFGAWEPKHR